MKRPDSGEGDGTVVIAVAAVGVVEMTVDEVVDMIAMGDGFVAAVGSVNVIGAMAGAVVTGSTIVGVIFGYCKGVFVVVITVMAMEVTVVKEVDVAVVENGGVSAAWPVDVDVIGVGMNAMGHGNLSNQDERSGRARRHVRER